MTIIVTISITIITNSITNIIAIIIIIMNSITITIIKIIVITDYSNTISNNCKINSNNNEINNNNNDNEPPVRKGQSASVVRNERLRTPDAPRRFFEHPTSDDLAVAVEFPESLLLIATINSYH